MPQFCQTPFKAESVDFIHILSVTTQFQCSGAVRLHAIIYCPNSMCLKVFRQQNTAQ